MGEAVSPREFPSIAIGGEKFSLGGLDGPEVIELERETGVSVFDIEWSAEQILRVTYILRRRVEPELVFDDHCRSIDLTQIYRWHDGEDPDDPPTGGEPSSTESPSEDDGNPTSSSTPASDPGKSDASPDPS